MATYALWNNKGGVGKSFLTFAVACEYAIANPDEDILILDLCPQANLTEMLLGGNDLASPALDALYADIPRRSVGGYLEARLTSPFIPLATVDDFIVRPSTINERVPSNVALVAGDNLVELLAEAMRQVSQMPLPSDAWSKVMRWLLDLIRAFSETSQASDVTTFVDCNPSFSIYTQMALCSSEGLIVPFTADDSSRRGIENVFALLYGIAASDLEGYAKLSFSKRAVDEGVSLPRIHALVSNRVTMYKGQASSAFLAKSTPIRDLVFDIAKKGKRHFTNFRKIDDLFVQMPDYHSVAVVASSEGCPLSLLKAGHHQIDGDTVQVNKNSISGYTKALANFLPRI
jgi:cellulose biosynthesis protein BcsQ